MLPQELLTQARHIKRYLLQREIGVGRTFFISHLTFNTVD